MPPLSSVPAGRSRAVGTYAAATSLPQLRMDPRQRPWIAQQPRFLFGGQRDEPARHGVLREESALATNGVGEVPTAVRHRAHERVDIRIECGVDERPRRIGNTAIATRGAYLARRMDLFRNDEHAGASRALPECDAARV